MADAAPTEEASELSALEAPQNVAVWEPNAEFLRALRNGTSDTVEEHIRVSLVALHL